MRLLVAGGRDWTDWQAVYRVLSRIHEKRPISLIIEGEGGKKSQPFGTVKSGVDLWGRTWAEAEDVACDPFPVPDEEWTRLGKKAGPLRNQRMIDEGKPDGAVVFPGGRGTQDMRKRLEKAGITRYEPIPLVPLSEKEAKPR